MATTHFPSLPDSDVIQVHFVTPAGAVVTRRLLVDSGFTGPTSFVLSKSDTGLSHAIVPSSQVTGALQGEYDRVLVMCRVPSVAFQRSLIAMLADLTPLALPDGVEGMAGLRFLRQFTRWGGERGDGGWRFLLAYDAGVAEG